MQNAWLRGHRQRQVNNLDAFALDQPKKLGLRPQQPVRGAAVQARGLPIVDKANQLGSGVASLTHPGCQCQPLLVHANNNGALLRTLQPKQRRRSRAQRKAGAKFA